ncbi:MAG: hypothetical protein COA97_09935 [Flavobacteriales bacterium]|nr:MAG: hypothetical protein COA97_09935 [Flavobacteriales bacterium]
MKNPFLHTEWRKLIMINYEVNPAILKPYLPFGTELDSWNGKYYVSVVGFKFLDTKVMGIKFPFHINFEQVNLRFYVKRKVKNEVRKGVVFIKEIIDKPIVKFVAKMLYKENYVQQPMRHSWQEDENHLNIKYEWKLKGKWNSIAVKTNKILSDTLKNSQERFIAEHYWGNIQIKKNKSYEFRVEHPAWKIYSLIDYSIDIDFETVYGKAFSYLQHKKPSSVFLVEGSEVSLGDRKLII